MVTARWATPPPRPQGASGHPHRRGGGTKIYGTILAHERQRHEPIEHLAGLGHRARRSGARPVGGESPFVVYRRTIRREGTGQR